MASVEHRVLYGPHGAPDFFTKESSDTFFAAEWQVHYNSNRLGVRLVARNPQWARQDGGEAVCIRRTCMTVNTPLAPSTLPAIFR